MKDSNTPTPTIQVATISPALTPQDLDDLTFAIHRSLALGDHDHTRTERMFGLLATLGELRDKAKEVV